MVLYGNTNKIVEWVWCEFLSTKYIPTTASDLMTSRSIFNSLVCMAQNDKMVLFIHDRQKDGESFSSPDEVLPMVHRQCRQYTDNIKKTAYVSCLFYTMFKQNMTGLQRSENTSINHSNIMRVLSWMKHVKFKVDHFWATACKTVRPFLSDHCRSCLSCSWRWCIVVKRLDGSR